MSKTTKIILIGAGTLLLCLTLTTVNILTAVDIYLGPHPTQDQLQALNKYVLIHQIVFVGGIPFIVFVGMITAFLVSKHHDVPR